MDNPICCMICMFREKDPKEIHANTIINGYALCWPHATSVMNRDDQMAGYARWMIDTEDNGRW